MLQLSQDFLTTLGYQIVAVFVVADLVVVVVIVAGPAESVAEIYSAASLVIAVLAESSAKYRVVSIESPTWMVGEANQRIGHWVEAKILVQVLVLLDLREID